MKATNIVVNIGIDPGKNGAFAVLIDRDLSVYHMPETLHEIVCLITTIQQYNSDRKICVALELVPLWTGYALPGAHIASLYGNCMFIAGIYSLLSQQGDVRFNLVAPQVWQRAYKDQSVIRQKNDNRAHKKGLLNCARKLYGKVATLKTCDAILLADYSKKNNKTC